MHCQKGASRSSNNRGEEHPISPLDVSERTHRNVEERAFRTGTAEEKFGQISWPHPVNKVLLCACARNSLVVSCA